MNRQPGTHLPQMWFSPLVWLNSRGGQARRLILCVAWLALVLLPLSAQAQGEADGHWALKQAARWTEIVNMDPTCQSVASGAEGSISGSQTCRHADGSTSHFAGTISWQWSTEAGRSLTALVPGQLVTVTVNVANTGNRFAIGGTFRMEKEDMLPWMTHASAIDIARLAVGVGAPASGTTGTLTVPQGPYFPDTALMSLRAGGDFIGVVDRIYEWVEGPPPPTPTATVTVTNTASATRTATPTATSTVIDILVANVEYSQVIQCLDQSTGATNCADNAVPMVKGKNTVVRVYPAMVGASAQQLTHNAELHMESPIQASIPSLNGPIPLKQAANREVADDTLNFRLPLEWTEYDEIQLRVELNADRAIPETNYGNNRRIFRITFHERRPLRVRYVPVRLPGNPSLPNEGKMRRAETLARTIFPLRQGDLHYVRGAPLDHPNGITTDAQLQAFVRLLSLLDSLGLLLGPGEPAYDQLVGWYPDQDIAIATGWSDPRWDMPPGSGRVAAAMTLTDSPPFNNNPHHDSYTLAHEIAHNLGLRHSSKRVGAPTKANACGAYSSVNHWPYETVDIQEVGYQVLLRGQAALKVPRTHSDLMSYCNYYDSQRNILDINLSLPSTAFWISPFSYHRLFLADGQPSFGLPVAAQRSAFEPASQWAVVRGLVRQNGASAIHGVHHVTSSVGADPLPAGTDYSIEWQDTSGMPLDSFSFDVDFINQEGEPVDEEPFLFVLPFPDDSERVVLKRGAAVLASHERSAHAPTLAITAPTRGASWTAMETIRWEAGDADGDSVTVALFYRPHDSSGWLPIDAGVEGSAFGVDSSEYPGGMDARVLLVATDGFNTTIATSEPFSVPRKAPQPIILEPLDGAELPAESPLVLVGSGYDLDDEVLEEATFEWSSDRVGLFATGAEVILDGLAEGDHRLTLTARDSDGTTGSDTITVHVRGGDDCVGDCNGDGQVTIDELIRGVNIALGTAVIDTCPALDRNRDGAVTIDELVLGVNHALGGCPAISPTPTATRTVTAVSVTATAATSPTRTMTMTTTVPPTPTSNPTGTATGTTTRTTTPTVPGPTSTLTRTPPPAVPTATLTPTGPPRYCSAIGNPIEIPDNEPFGIESTLVVNQARIIDRLAVTVWIDHTWVGDLVVSLVRLEDLTTVVLIDRPGHPATAFGCTADDVICELTDAASLFAEDQCSSESPALQGVLRPANSLAVFSGDDLAGTWMLRVADVSVSDTGRLIQWCIQADHIDGL